MDLGTVVAVREALNNGAGINERIRDGNTLLSRAARQGHVDEVTFLLEKDGIDLNSKDNDGRTPLSWAAENGKADVVKLLLEKDGIDLNSKDNNGWTPFSWAVREWESQVYCSEGETPDSRSTRRGHIDVVKFLLAKEGIDLNSTDKVGRTPLSWAAENGWKEAVELLLGNEGIDPNFKDNDGRTPLSWAAGRNDQYGEYGDADKVVTALVKNGRIDLDSEDNNGRTPLSWAAENGIANVVKLLLKEDRIDPNFKDNNGRTPLSWAVENGNGKIVKLLLKEDRIDPNSKDNNGRTPFSLAVEKGFYEVVKLLLETNDVSLNSEDNNGRTPLSWAVGEGNRKVVELLLKTKGIDLNFKDKIGRTPLSWAAEKNDSDLVKLLSPKDTITLHTLVQEGKLSLVRLLLRAGYDVNTIDSLGKTPLHVAITSWHLEIATALISFNATETNMEDNDGMIPLRLATWIECPDLIELLLEKSALPKDILADEWRKAYGKQASDIIMLLERDNQKTSLGFITEAEVLKKSGQVSIRSGTGRRLVLVSHSSAWESQWIPGSKVELKPYGLEISPEPSDNSQVHTISVGIQFPSGQDLEHPESFEVSDWNTCRIVWTMTSTLGPSDNRYWKSLDYFSMLPFGWIPDDGIDFFKQIHTPSK